MLFNKLEMYSVLMQHATQCTILIIMYMYTIDCLKNPRLSIFKATGIGNKKLLKVLYSNLSQSQKKFTKLLIIVAS